MARYKPDALLTKGDAREILDIAERLIEFISEKQL